MTKKKGRKLPLIIVSTLSKLKPWQANAKTESKLNQGNNQTTRHHFLKISPTDTERTETQTQTQSNRNARETPTNKQTNTNNGSSRCPSVLPADLIRAPRNQKSFQIRRQ